MASGQPPHGNLTAKVAEILHLSPNRTAYEVLCHHGQQGATAYRLGAIVPSCRRTGAAPLALGSLDIAIVSPLVNNLVKAWVLVEIEETDAEPKRLLGDLVTLLGDRLTFPGLGPGSTDLLVGQWTTLMVLVAAPSTGALAKVECLRAKLVMIQNLLCTHDSTAQNACLGRIIVAAFQFDPKDVHASGISAVAADLAHRIESEALNNQLQWR